MPKNIILFYDSKDDTLAAHVGHLLKKSFSAFKKNGFNSLCIEHHQQGNIDKSKIDGALTHFAYSSAEVRERCRNNQAQLEWCQAASQLGFMIYGVEYKINEIDSWERLRIDRPKNQLSKIKELNHQGKNCIVLLDKAHLAGLEKSISQLLSNEQVDYQLAYLCMSRMGLYTYTYGRVPIRIYNMSHPKEQERFLTQIALIPPISWQNNALHYGVRALVTGLGLYTLYQSTVMQAENLGNKNNFTL